MNQNDDIQNIIQSLKKEIEDLKMKIENLEKDNQNLRIRNNSQEDKIHYLNSKTT